MQRYFVDEQNWQSDTVNIIGDDRHHIVNVMRMNVGDSLIACHPKGVSYQCSIIAINTTEVTCQIVNKLVEQNELPIDIIIAQGLLKGDKLDFVVQKSTELGMKSFVPLKMERSVVKWDNKKEEKKLARLKKIVKEASEQSERSLLPTVYNSMTLEELINEIEYDHLLVASEYLVRENNTSNHLKSAISQINASEKVLIVFGPEGGFSEQEIQFLNQNDCKFIRLGKRILRAETAPLYALSTFSFYFEEWRC